MTRPTHRALCATGGVLVAAVLGTLACARLLGSPPDAVVIAHEWWWEVRYPGGATAVNELHVPAGHRAAIRLESRDGDHGFTVDALGLSMRATPSHPVEVTFAPSASVAHAATCVGSCGPRADAMTLTVTVESPPLLDAWRAHQLEPAPSTLEPLALRGRAIFLSKTCPTCHAIRGVTGPTELAPDLTHVGSRPTLGAGASPNDPASLARWIVEPQAVKPGSHMPTLKLTDEEVGALVAFLGALR